MEFDKISGLNSFNFNTQKKADKKAPAQNASASDYSAPDKKTPVDPKYWQSVAFLGAKKPEKTPEELLKEGEAHLEEALSELRSNFWRETPETFERYASKLKSLTHLGAKAMDKYIIFAVNSITLYDSERTKKFDMLTDDFFSNYTEINDEDMRHLFDLMRNVTSPGADNFQERREFFNALIKDDKHSVNDKLDWFVYKVGSGIFSKTYEENLESVDVFSRYLSFCDTDEERYKFRDIEMSDEIILDAVELMESNLISKDDFLAASKDVTHFNEEKKENFSFLIRNLHALAIKKGDVSSAQYFKNLFSKKLADRISLQAAYALINQNSPQRKQAAAFFREEGEKRGAAFFQDERDMIPGLDAIVPENFEDFKTIFDIERKKDSFSMYYFMNDYVNPATQHFDKKIYEGVQDFIKKAEKYKGGYNSWFFDRCSEIIKAAVDRGTGEISKDALDFIDKYYFQIEKPNKVKNAAKSVIGTFHYFPTPFYKNYNNNLDGRMAEILNLMRDNSGSFNPKNISAMEKILEMPINNIQQFSFFKDLKDEKGVVDKTKFKFAMSILEKTSDSKTLCDVMRVFKKLGNDDALMAYNSTLEIFPTETSALNNLGQFVKHCWGDGEDKVENAIFVKDICDISESAPFLTDDLFKTIQNPLNKSLILEFAQEPNFNGYQINGLLDVISNLGDERDTLSDFTKEKAKSFLKTGISLHYFTKLYQACIEDENNPESSFKEEQFNKISNLYSVNGNICYEIEPKILVDIIEEKFQPTTLKFKEKVSLLNAFMKLKETPEKIGFKEEFLNKIITDLDRSLRDDSIYLPVTDDAKSAFVKNVLSSPKDEALQLSHFEKVLVDSIPILEDMADGLKLSVSKEDLFKELNEICDTEDKIKVLKEKTGINPIVEENDGKFSIKGYDGIILLDKLNKEDEFEGKLYNTLHKFMYENEVITSSFELNEEVNKIIKACPEFINIIGKPQHSTHKYSLDVHSLLVLAYSLQNPDYQKLSPTDKMMLKISTIFHDIAKARDTVDDGHQEPSSIYTRSIVKKFFTNEDSRDRVYELIRNHHWLARYANSADKEKCSKELAYKFRRYNDFEIAKIMARADLMAVSPEFYESHKDALDTIQPIQDKLNEFYSTGCAVFSDYPVNSEALKDHIQTKDGREYKVINFHEIEGDEDLSSYGFENGKTKDNVNFLVHMVDTGRMAADLRTVDMLTSSVNGGVLSESIITPNYNRTYCDRKYGVLLSQINANVINMASSNQGSGTEKDDSDIIRLVFDLDSYYSARRNFRTGFLEALNLDKNSVSDEEFAEFYKKNIVSKTLYSQFAKTKEYNLGGRTFTSDEIISAIKEYQNSLVDKEQTQHNEIVGYIPKIKGVIAKSASLDEVPDRLLNFAYENNLPVVLI